MFIKFFSGLLGIFCVKLLGELLFEVCIVVLVDCMLFILYVLCVILLELFNCFIVLVREEIDCKILFIFNWFFSLLILNFWIYLDWVFDFLDCFVICGGGVFVFVEYEVCVLCFIFLVFLFVVLVIVFFVIFCVWGLLLNNLFMFE